MTTMHGGWIAAAVMGLALTAQAGEGSPFAAWTVTEQIDRSEFALQGPGPQPGAVVITEFMKDPNFVTDTRGEWIEVRNNQPWRVNLEGWKLRDDTGNEVVLTNGGQGIRILPGQYLVLGNNGDPTQNGGVTVNHVYAGWVLGNGADQIELQKPTGLIIDRLEYDDGILWPDAPGRSISLRGDVFDVFQADDPANWCEGATPWSAGNPDLGTPGQPNPVCP